MTSAGGFGPTNVFCAIAHRMFYCAIAQRQQQDVLLCDSAATGCWALSRSHRTWRSKTELLYFSGVAREKKLKSCIWLLTVIMT